MPAPLQPSAADVASGGILPLDHEKACLVGRVWVDTGAPGPRVAALRDDKLIDLSGLAPTMAHLLDGTDIKARVEAHSGPVLGTIQEFLDRRALLAPCDLQAVKASGVTFIASAIERVIEERCQGAREQAGPHRQSLRDKLEFSLIDIVPGSARASEVKDKLIKAGLWSQYLEVAIGPDPEIFTKAQPMSSVGCGADIGVHPDSQWNNPEPEIVLAISPAGEAVGATLGNDVNLSDVESRSALLLGKAKDNNASCAIGPFIRLFDDDFRLADIRTAEVTVTISGADGFETAGVNTMNAMSRAPQSLVAATIGNFHQYPDGLMLFLGTTFTPTCDRETIGGGFTHREDDHVRIESPRLGALENRVTTSDRAPPWRYGVRDLMRSLAARQLL